MKERRAADLVDLALALADPGAADALLLKARRTLERTWGGSRVAVLDLRQRATYRAEASAGIHAAALERLLRRACGPDASLIYETALEGTLKLPPPRWASAYRSSAPPGGSPAAVVAAWTPPGPDPPSRQSLARAARIVAGALHTSHGMQRLLEQSIHDPLTATMNRRGLNEVLRREIAAARRHGRSMAVLYIDVDDFKSVNDRFGHGVGDTVLNGFAGRLRLLLRASDTIGRIGGDEFIAVLPDSNLDAAKRLARRLARELFSVPLPTEAGALVLRATFGAAALDETRDSPEAILQAADQQLIRNKRRRRATPRRREVSGNAAADAWP